MLFSILFKVTLTVLSKDEKDKITQIHLELSAKWADPIEVTKIVPCKVNPENLILLALRKGTMFFTVLALPPVVWISIDLLGENLQRAIRWLGLGSG